MADGKTHFIHNCIVAAATTGAAFYYDLPVIPVVAANVVGLIVTPDIDMESKTHSEVIVATLLARITTGFLATKKRLKSVSRIYAALIMSITAPYAFLFPHRSWLTHLPPFSVAVQILYFYLVYYAFCKIFDISYISVRPYWDNPELLLTQTNILVFAVLNVHHLIHLIGDGGMILLFGNKVYVFTKPFYNLSRHLFPQSKRD
jgi:hypothetical protein